MRWARRFASSVVAGAGKRVAVAMSGGIDSAVSAFLLKRAGYDCVGVFMRNWDRADEVDGVTTACPIDRDRSDWQEVCRRLDIPAVEVEFVKEYWSDVFVPMLDSYQAGGQTPNPDVACNRSIKFNHFRKHVFDHLQVDFMATGHYARIAADDGDQAVLLRGLDARKDQSYFLCMTPGANLRNVLFPIGHLHKADVKAIGQEQFQGLGVLTKPESMGLCFVGKRDMRSFLGAYLALTPGRFIDYDTGAAVGSHEGKELFTVGQGARISGVTDRYFVTFAEDGAAAPQAGPQPGDVFVVRGAAHPRLLSKSCTLHGADVSWVAGQPPPSGWLEEGGRGLGSSGGLLSCKSRYNQPPETCRVTSEPGPGGELLHVHFDAPVRAITRGQVLALYHGDVCLGGGVIQ